MDFIAYADFIFPLSSFRFVQFIWTFDTYRNDYSVIFTARYFVSVFFWLCDLCLSSVGIQWPRSLFVLFAALSWSSFSAAFWILRRSIGNQSAWASFAQSCCAVLIYLSSTWVVGRLGHFFFLIGLVPLPLVCAVAMSKSSSINRIWWCLCVFSVSTLGVCSPHSFVLNCLVFSFVRGLQGISFSGQRRQWLYLPTFPNNVKDVVKFAGVVCICSSSLLLPSAWDLLGGVRVGTQTASVDELMALLQRQSLNNVIIGASNWYWSASLLARNWYQPGFYGAVSVLVIVLMPFFMPNSILFSRVRVFSIIILFGWIICVLATTSLRWCELECTPFSTILQFMREPDKFLGLSIFALSMLIPCIFTEMSQFYFVKSNYFIVIAAPSVLVICGAAVATIVSLGGGLWILSESGPLGVVRLPMEFSDVIQSAENSDDCKTGIVVNEYDGAHSWSNGRPVAPFLAQSLPCLVIPMRSADFNGVPKIAIDIPRDLQRNSKNRLYEWTGTDIYSLSIFTAGDSSVIHVFDNNSHNSFITVDRSRLSVSSSYTSLIDSTGSNCSVNRELALLSGAIIVCGGRGTEVFDGVVVVERCSARAILPGLDDDAWTTVRINGSLACETLTDGSASELGWELIFNTRKLVSQFSVFVSIVSLSLLIFYSLYVN